MSITWNGVSSDTIGVIVERIPNRYVPTRRFSPQQVAGRNGNILLVDKAFPNVEQEYEVYLSAEAQGLPSVARACAEWLMGPDGYCRLTDSYDTTVYREAFLMGGFDIENILNKFGRCTITFSCKPQKYLLAGDTPIEIPDGTTTTYTGDVVQFDVITGASITSLSATISPIQDLHGYDHPWPAGGGKNLIEPWPNAVTTSGITVEFTENGEVWVHGTPTIQSGYIAFPFNYFPNSVIGKTITISVNEKTVGIGFNVGSSNGNLNITMSSTLTSRTGTYTATGETAGRFTVNVNYDVGTINKIYKVQFEIGPSATTWTPYSNICPITGRTGLNVYRTGKNLLDKANVLQDLFIKPVTMKIGAIGDTGASVYCPIKGGETYTVSKIASARFTIATTTDLPANNVSINDYRANNSATSLTIQTTENDKYIVAFVYLASADTGKTQQEIVDSVQVEQGSTATTYEPYNGNTYSVDWTSEAGTVYGGTLDVVTGVLTVDRAIVDLGTLNYTYDSAGRFYTSINGKKNEASDQDMMLAISSMYMPMTATAFQNSPTDGTMRGATIGGYVYFRNSAYTDAATFKTAMSGVQLCYELATPLTYQLTATQVEALVGKNNVWSSSGDVSVTVTTLLGGIVTNPTPFEARPLLTVSGVGEITINGKSIQILESVSDFEIDCETMEAEDNSKIYCMDFPELSGGENKIVGYGSITALTVTPRWWTL